MKFLVSGSVELSVVGWIFVMVVFSLTSTPAYSSLISDDAGMPAVFGMDGMANWSLSLDEPRQRGPSDARLTYSGRIANKTSTDLFLEHILVSVTADADIRTDFTDDFLSMLSVIPVGGYTGTLFYIEWLDGARVGSRGTGTFEIGAAAPGFPVVITVDFEAEIADIPESNTIVLLLSGAASMVLARQQRLSLTLYSGKLLSGSLTGNAPILRRTSLP
jgi:hypothetical protein